MPSTKTHTKGDSSQIMKGFSKNARLPQGSYPTYYSLLLQHGHLPKSVVQTCLYSLRSCISSSKVFQFVCTIMYSMAPSQMGIQLVSNFYLIVDRAKKFSALFPSLFPLSLPSNVTYTYVLNYHLHLLLSDLHLFS